MTFTRARTRRSAASVFLVFALGGMTFATWASRLPTVRDQLDLRPDQIGVVLLVGALGSLVSLPLTGRVVDSIGARRTTLLATGIAVLGMLGAVFGVTQISPPLVAAGLFVAMLGIGSWDMAMNFAGTVVERALGRSIMPWFHAGFSLGATVGAAGGALASAHGVGLPLHMGIAMAVVAIGVGFGVRGYLPDPQDSPEPNADDGAAAKPASGGFVGAWLEGRTLLIGLVVLSAALTEGAANDWLALAVVDGFGVSNGTGAFAFAIFIAAMTAMRFGGTWLLDRFGRLAILVLCTALAIVGLLAFALMPSLPGAVVGAVLWGCGAALGFPVGMSAAADEPARAAARLSVVSTIGYSAFLAGPPLLGLLANHVGYRTALLAVLVPLVASLLAVRSVVPRAPRA